MIISSIDSIGKPSVSGYHHFRNDTRSPFLAHLVSSKYDVPVKLVVSISITAMIGGLLGTTMAMDQATCWQFVYTRNARHQMHRQVLALSACGCGCDTVHDATLEYGTSLKLWPLLVKPAISLGGTPCNWTKPCRKVTPGKEK